jgi:hypothetical protein
MRFDVVRAIVAVAVKGSAQEVDREARLKQTGVDPDEGKVKTQMSASRETLEIEGDKLDSNVQINMLVDGFSLSIVTTDGSGSFKIDFITENSSPPAHVRPVSNIQRVDVIDSQGRIVLTGGTPSVTLSRIRNGTKPQGPGEFHAHPAFCDFVPLC